MLGEGSQLAAGDARATDAALRRHAGPGPKGPDVFLSVSDPKRAGGIEVMGWERGTGGFNFYRSTGIPRCGCSPATRGRATRSEPRQGPVREPPERRAADEGAQDAVEQLALAGREHPGDRVRHERPAAHAPLVHEEGSGRRPRLELEAARPAITRWANARFTTLRTRGGTVTRPADHGADPRHADGQPDHHPHREPGAARPARSTSRPRSLSTRRGCRTCSASPRRRFHGHREDLRGLEKFDVRIEDGRGSPQGDTHFCFLVPERAFEDQVVLREAIEMGLVSKRLAACLLMVDPWNPIFSDRRRALLAHVPRHRDDREAARAPSRRHGANDPRGRRARRAESPEAEFAARWKAGTGSRRRSTGCSAATTRPSTRS